MIYHGAMRLTEHGFPAIGLPGTPINGYNCWRRIDKIRDTIVKSPSYFCYRRRDVNAGVPRAVSQLVLMKSSFLKSTQDEDIVSIECGYECGKNTTLNRLG